MTSTEFKIGLDGARSSSKVLKPPGGGSSDIFGSATRESFKIETNTKDRLFAPVQENQPTPTKKNQSISNIFGSNANEMTKSTKKKYVHRNPITGEETVYNVKDETKEENCNIENNGTSEPASEITAKPVQTSIRVKNPPGGKSTGIF